MQRLKTVLALPCLKSQGHCDGPPEMSGLISTPTWNPELSFPADALQSGWDSGPQGTYNDKLSISSSAPKAKN